MALAHLPLTLMSQICIQETLKVSWINMLTTSICKLGIQWGTPSARNPVCWTMGYANNLPLNGRKLHEGDVIQNRKILVPHELKWVERVTALKILGVSITSNLQAVSHVEEVVVSCSGAPFVQVIESSQWRPLLRSSLDLFILPQPCGVS